MSYTKNFFDEKNEWSRYKDILLNGYLVTYFTKVMRTGIDIVYIDGFAGKGKFQDGSIGSPLIAKNAIYQAKGISKTTTKIFPYFIEFEFADELTKNLSDRNSTVISGDYKTEVPKILNSQKGKNIFLYVDPFGIKYLDFEIFKNLKTSEYKSVELLLNLNSFGFIREACRLLKLKQEAFDDELPDNVYSSDKAKNTTDNMNKIANGDYWIEIVEEYNAGKYDIFEAEQIFLERYKDELKRIFGYVYSIPIKKSKSRLSKYQMIFATNHKDGAMLMADEMIKCNNLMQNKINNGQMWFFDYNYSLNNISKVVYDVITDYYTNIKDLYDKIYTTYGFLYLTSDINKELKNLENQDKIIIQRIPPFTDKGKPTKSMDIKKHTIRVKRK